MSRVCRTKKMYVDTLKDLMSAREDFKDLEYHRDNTTNEEYLFLHNVIGYVFMFNITGYTEAEIFHAMAMVECGEEPACRITDKAELLRLGKLFND